MFCLVSNVPLLGLKSGYWKVAFNAEHEDISAIFKGSGLYQFKVILLESYNASATFERLMRSWYYQDWIWICLVYLEGIIDMGANTWPSSS